VYSDAASVIAQPRIDDVSQTVLQMPLRPGITPDKAVNAMINKAADLNMTVISHQKISAQLHQRGIKSRHLEILQLCRPENAATAIEFNLHFAAYIPCRITLVEDKNGQIWILVQNIDFQVNNKLMKPASVEFAIRINQDLLSIVTAGINGKEP
jgi:uncharacterized protein (DUF302 family)